MSNVMDWKPMKVFKESDIPQGVDGYFKGDSFQSHMQTLHSYYFCFNKSLIKPAKTSIVMFIQLLSKESETLQSAICNPSSACFLQ